MNSYSLSIYQGTPSFIHLCSFLTEQVYYGIYTEKKIIHCIWYRKEMLPIFISEPEFCQQEWSMIASPAHNKKLRWVDLQHSVYCLCSSCILSKIIPEHWYIFHSCKEAISHQNCNLIENHITKEYERVNCASSIFSMPLFYLYPHS